MSSRFTAVPRLLAVLMLVLTATCGSPPPLTVPTATAPAEAPPPTPLAALPRDATWGLRITTAPDQIDYAPTHNAETLDAAAVRQLLERANLARKPASPIRRLRSPNTNNGAPGPQRASAIDRASPLVAFGPVGNANRQDTFVSLTFAGPVVGSAEVGVALTQPPFRLVPEIAGTWRWLDASVLAFQPTAELPMATRFAVTYAGPTSPHVTWSIPHEFETAALEVVDCTPAPGSSEVSSTPTVFLHFNQRVEPDALLPFLSFEAAGKRIAARLTGKHPTDPSYTTAAQDPEAWLRVRPEAPLPSNAKVRVVLERGAPSAEGPKTLTAPLQVEFTTAGAEGCSPGRACKPKDHHRRGHGSLNLLDDAARFDKRLRVGGEELQVLPAVRPPLLTFETQGVAQAKAAVYRVNPSDFPTFRQYRDREQSGRRSGTPLEEIPPGEFLEMRSFDAHVTPDWTPHSLDLSSYLRNGFGHLVVQVTAGKLRETRWVQVTNLGLLRQGRTNEARVFAFDLNDRRPLAGVNSSLLGGSPTAVTDADGVATLPLGNSSGYQVLVAKRGPDTTFESFWAVAPAPPALAWKLTDSHSRFAPSGDVVLAGNVGPTPLTKHYGAGKYGIAYRVQPRFWRLTREPTYSQGSVPVGDDGRFELGFRLPDVDAKNCTLELELRRDDVPIDKPHERDLPIHLSQAPDRELTVTASASRVLTGESLTVTARIGAPGGAALAGEDVYWRAEALRSRINPPGYPDFAFGPEELRVNDASGSLHLDEENRGESVYLGAKTDAHGQHRLQVSLTDAGPFPRRVLFTASTQPWRDAAGRPSPASKAVVETRTAVFVAPGSATVGLRPARSFVLAGQLLEVEVVVVDYLGRPLPNHDVVIQAGRQLFEDGASFEPTSECRLRSTEAPRHCKLPTKTAGVHRVMASVVDARGRRSDSETSVFVAGEEQLSVLDGLLAVVEPARAGTGEPHRLLLETPHVPASGWLQLTRADAVIERRRVSIDAPITVLMLPTLTESAQADLWLVGAAAPVEFGAYAPASKGLPVSMHAGVSLPASTPSDRGVAVSLRLAAASHPNTWTLVAEVTAHGNPTAGRRVELLLDRSDCAARAGVRSLGSMMNKVAHTFQPVVEGTSDNVLRPKLPSNDTDFRQNQPKSEADKRREELTAHLYHRADSDDGGDFLRTTADRDSVAPPLPTVPAPQTSDAHGRVEFRISAPEPAGTYCATALADGDELHARSESLPLTVPHPARAGQLPLRVSLAAPPRFAAGDLVQLTATVQNPDLLPRTVRSALAVSGATLDGAAGYELELGAGETAQLPFLIRAKQTGETLLELAVASAQVSATTPRPLSDYQLTPVVTAKLRVEEANVVASSVQAPKSAAQPPNASSPMAFGGPPVEVSRYYESAQGSGSVTTNTDDTVLMSHDSSLSAVLVVRVRQAIPAMQIVDRLPAGLTLLVPPVDKRTLRAVSAEVRTSPQASAADAAARSAFQVTTQGDDGNLTVRGTDLKPGVYLIRYPVHATFRGRYQAVPPTVIANALPTAAGGGVTWLTIE